MNSPVLIKTYSAPPLCREDILRYAISRDSDDVCALMESCLTEVLPHLTYKVCYRKLHVTSHEGSIDLGVLRADSRDLCAIIGTASDAVLFAATLGVGIDRAIAKYSGISPARALMLQAIGTERIEALCDTFCSDISKEYGLPTSQRFSPGYGDLRLEVQKSIFTALSPERAIGLTLTDSMIMSPSKSVTAIVALGTSSVGIGHKCDACNTKNCAFRGTT